MQQQVSSRSIKFAPKLPVMSLTAMSLTLPQSVSLYDVFRELPIVASKLGPWLAGHGQLEWETLERDNHVKEWQRTLIGLTLLSKKFKVERGHHYWEIVISDACYSPFRQELLPRYIHDMDERRPTVLRFGWLLFLTLKAKLLPAFPDLVSCHTLLACVLNFLVAHAPNTVIQLHQNLIPVGSIVDSLQIISGEEQRLGP